MKKIGNQLVEHAGIVFWGFVLICFIILLIVKWKTIFRFLKNQAKSFGAWYTTVFLPKKQKWWKGVKTTYTKWKVDVLNPWWKKQKDDLKKRWEERKKKKSSVSFALPLLAIILVIGGLWFFLGDFSFDIPDFKFTWDTPWFYIIFGLIVALAVIILIIMNFRKKWFSWWEVAGFLFALSLFLSLCFWVYQITRPTPKPPGYYNHTQTDYDAQFAHPSLGGESVPINLGKNKGSGEVQVHDGHLEITFMEGHTYSKGQHFHVAPDKVGMLFVPLDEDVWHTLTWTHIDGDVTFPLVIMTKKVGDKTYLHVKNVKSGDIYKKGVYCVVPSEDIRFSLRSMSDNRATIVYD